MSRPNLGEGGPLAGEGAGGVENGASVEGESLGHGGTKVPAPEHEICRQGLVYGTRQGGKKGGQNTIKQVKRERKRQRQHLKAHQKARKTTSEHTKHISPHSMNTHTRTHTQQMALPENKDYIKEISVGKIMLSYDI